MKKLTKRARSNLLNALVILFTIVLVIYLGAKNGDIGDAYRALRSARTPWLLAAAGTWSMFMVFEAMGLHVFFRQQKLKVPFRTSLLVSMIGMFYSSVTPAATGGQPMQVFSFKKRGVPTGLSSSGLAVKFFCYQTALLALGGVMWLVHPGLVAECIKRGRVLVATGFVLNGVTVALVLLLAINKNIVRGIITLLIRAGKALHLVKDVAKTASRADAALVDFHASVDMLTHHPVRLLVLLGISVVQVLGQMSIAYCVYRAMGQSAATYSEILALQTLLQIAASFTPLPGASGAQEGGFYLFFQDMFPESKLLGALLLWRFFTYYLTLIVGLGCVIGDSADSIRRRKRSPLEQPEKGDLPIEPEETQREAAANLRNPAAPAANNLQETERENS